ncbi:MAG TPA: LysM peptidoglycan-binding domain-containing protein [Anaerohalosphaeraceae bacterium]|jgi:nucleoid-associated protein YgaU|nr:LysM peptidoglycan-binding domain-containing protein [Phycisphaerae bacterium]HOT72714.1 LysM peptidoglycan-binding domain-containing protein [Anaerohalosphaeraceae bacterium]HQG04872.1 LysM peptidoglycan-binding domain-containing protein [Anaerohalosphaeraceae bacterium]HQI07407.1 LysM peptidoglycan-binding domain-containing protein [Anaerohalosphaeraceae bacterium]HQJ67693.1 LysM peptidoglycan-binding domain-containing protein [Anaerohalosphaeraceae bacterium]
MTSDGKIGLLISFLFIVTIAFLINGPKGLFKTDKPVIETAVQVPSGRSILIEQAVEEAARELEPVPLRQTQPPTAVQIITPVPTASSAAEPSVPAVLPSPDTSVSSNTSAAPAPSAPAAIQTHTVQKGETLAAIASRYYGKEAGNTRAVIQKLYQANQHILTSPDILRVGDKLIIPPLEKVLNSSSSASSASSAKPEKALLEKFKNVFEPVSSGRTSPRYVEYVVQPGDRLWDIAQQYLGDGKRYTEIVRINQDQVLDPDNVPAGIRLKIPVR